MRNDLKNLFLSFGYAFRGIIRTIGHERNLRIHLTCMIYMFYFLLRYDYFIVSRTQFAILFLACALVIGGELINTGIEKANDTATTEQRMTVAVSKDAAAGAVLVFAIFAVLVGIALLWQPEAFRLLFAHYRTRPIYLLYFVLSLVVANLFMFKFDFNHKDRNKK